MVYLGLGSNIGDRIKYIRYALEQLGRLVFQNMDIANIYETEAVEYIEQPKFLNTVCGGETEHPPEKLLELCQKIEQEAGRTRVVRKGPRTLDIDILLYDDLVIHNPNLTIPHPGIQGRRFVLLPLLELCPECRVPDTHLRYASYLENTKIQGVKLWSHK